MRALLRSCLAEKLRQLAPHALVGDFKASIAQTVTSGAFAGGEGGVGSLMIPSENLRAQLREHGSGKQIRTEPTLGAVNILNESKIYCRAIRIIQLFCFGCTLNRGSRWRFVIHISLMASTTLRVAAALVC